MTGEYAKAVPIVSAGDTGGFETIKQVADACNDILRTNRYLGHLSVDLGPGAEERGIILFIEEHSDYDDAAGG